MKSFVFESTVIKICLIKMPGKINLFSIRVGFQINEAAALRHHFTCDIIHFHSGQYITI